MPRASVKRLIECEKKQLIDLVLDIEKYPTFVPYCIDARVYEKIDNGDFIGGNYLTAINISSDVDILESFETTSFNVFLDMANVWGVDYSSAIDDSNKLRSAVGISLDWFTPVGPLNFSLAQPLLKKDTDKTESFRFNLGTTF